MLERWLAPMSITLPTHASLMTGTYPIEHGALANPRHGGRPMVRSPRLVTFARACREVGYAAGGFVSAAPVKRTTGIEDGFDHFDDPVQPWRDGRATTDAALHWLDGTRGPLLLWLHLFDPHSPYDQLFESDAVLAEHMARVPPVEEHRLPHAHTEWAVSHYDGEVSCVDAQVGRLLEALRARPEWERPAVLVVGDHGEGLNEHGEMRHGFTWA